MFSNSVLCSELDLPNKSISPGKTRITNVQELCGTSTKYIRKTTIKTKNFVYKKYNIINTKDKVCTGPSNSCYEVDHVIPLCLGGADDINNLWPQLYDGKYGAHSKNKLEKLLYYKMCKKEISIEEAQNCINDNWVICYKKYFEKG